MPDHTYTIIHSQSFTVAKTPASMIFDSGRKPRQTGREHVKRHTESKSEANPRLWSREAAALRPEVLPYRTLTPSRISRVAIYSTVNSKCPGNVIIERIITSCTTFIVLPQ